MALKCQKKTWKLTAKDYFITDLKYFRLLYGYTEFLYTFISQLNDKN